MELSLDSGFWASKYSSQVSLQPGVATWPMDSKHWCYVSPTPRRLRSSAPSAPSCSPPLAGEVTLRPRRAEAPSGKRRKATRWLETSHSEQKIKHLWWLSAVPLKCGGKSTTEASKCPFTHDSLPVRLRSWASVAAAPLLCSASNVGFCKLAWPLQASTWWPVLEI